MSRRSMWRPAWMSAAAIVALTLLALPFLGVTHAGQRDEPATISPASEDSEAPASLVRRSFSSDQETGAVAWILEAPETGILGAAVSYEIDLADYRPLDITLFDANGPRQPPLARGGDNAHWLVGDGVAYAGIGDTSYQTPAVRGEPPHRTEWGMETDLSAGRTVVLVSWARQPGPFSIILDYPADVVLEEVRGTSVASYEFADARGGAKVGVPAAARVHMQNSVAHTSSGGFLYSSVGYSWSEAFGVGGLAVRADEHTERVDWTNLTGAATGIRFKYGHLVTFSAKDLELQWDYVGDGRRTSLYVIVAELPMQVLPPGIWIERGIKQP